MRKKVDKEVTRQADYVTPVLLRKPEMEKVMTEEDKVDTKTTIQMHRRYLVKQPKTNGVFELMVLEYSPSGRYVKIKEGDRESVWVDNIIGLLSVIEELPNG